MQHGFLLSRLDYLLLRADLHNLPKMVKAKKYAAVRYSIFYLLTDKNYKKT